MNRYLGVFITTQKEHSDGKFPIVGIGASAGGLSAFEAFFSGMPIDQDPDMAFVLVQHLDPDHKSILVDLIQRCTKMTVTEVEDGMIVQKNWVYIIPPNHDMELIHGKLKLLNPLVPRGQRLPIDFFFRSLAQDLHERAIGIILSGTGSDGTFGVRAIKGEAGMCMIQKIDNCEFNGMPSSALATGLIDFELLPAEMPAQIIKYVSLRKEYPSIDGQSFLGSKDVIGDSLNRIFNLLRSHTGHDFSQYKPSTINRRIERRMAVNHIETISKYLQFLEGYPDEVEALFRDVLIGVTNFFRDPEAFKALEEQIIPKLFLGKQTTSVIRVWSAGCSTGEEAYSIAILLLERMEFLKQSFVVQIFATDIDSRAIATARSGIYPASIAADITPERLARFFILEPDGNSYRIHKAIRDLLVFSEQDLIRDPPFSKLDLIICRNVLIYFGTELQEKIVRLFHFGLNPKGMLFLGTSEGGGDFNELFNVIDRKWKLYERKEHFQNQSASLGPFLPLLKATKAGPPLSNEKRFVTKLPIREITEKALLDQLISAGLLVNAKGNILYQHGRTGMYLEPAPGEAGINNILKMAREGLRASLSTTLHKTVTTNEVMKALDLRVKTNGHFTMVNLTVCPIKNDPNLTPDSPLYLVILEEVPESILPDDSKVDKSTDKNTEVRIAALERELVAKDEQLQNAHEELDRSTEELKSANEEMQSINEELQSANEELKTSKEELQSVNEELSTVNSELNRKVLDLSRLNNDMNNLLAGSGIATIFVDHQLKILRFTPNSALIINLIIGDIGRPVTQIASNLLKYNQLESDLHTVLDTLIEKEARVQAKSGRWYLMRMMPYRTIDNIIEGAVITFFDITEMKNTEDLLSKYKRESRLAAVVHDSSDAITVQDLEGQTMAWNPGAEKLYGWSEAEALKIKVSDRIPANLQSDCLDILTKLARNEILVPYQSERLSKNGDIISVWITATSLINEEGKVYAIATTERGNIKTK